MQAKYTSQTAKIKERFDSLGVTYKGTSQTGGLISKDTSTPSSSYFYHSDHLGSSSLITDQSGAIVQHLEYVPYGETFIDERKSQSSWTTPYLFSGKERDEETGLLYFGARYQDSKYGIWYSVDPLKELKPWIGSYVYCSDNPINRFDLDGNIDFALFGYSGINKIDINATSDFHNMVVRTSLFKEERKVGTSPHIGIDYRAKIGTTVYSLGDGEIVDVGTFKSGIKYLSIKYKNGDILRFLHLSKINEGLKKGGKVYEGQIIGESGNSGKYKNRKGEYVNYEAHLHVDATDVNGNSISPEEHNYGTVSSKDFFTIYNGDYHKLLNSKQQGSSSEFNAPNNNSLSFNEWWEPIKKQIWGNTQSKN